MSEFCPLCDVSLDLHSGPDTCSLAMRKAFVIGEFYGITTRVFPPGQDQ